MSSFSNNPMTLLLLPFLLLLLILSPSSSASPHKLTELECLNSDTPNTCLSCVNSDPAASKADRTGIAAIVVGCLSRHAGTLSSNFTAMASHEKDKKLKEKYLKCSKYYFGAHRILHGWAMKSLKEHKYDDAESFVVKAWKYDYGCYGTLFGHNYYNKVGDVVKEGMKKYEELNEAACRIIERLT